MNRIEEKCFVFEWHIENFSYCWQRKGEGIGSPSFVVETLEETIWSLRIFPAGLTNEEYIEFFLQREEDEKGPSAIEIKYELFLDKKCSSGVNKRSFNKYTSRSFREYLKREQIFGVKKMSCLPKDTLTLCCKMWESTGNMKQNGLCVARTRIGVERRSCVRTVERFSSLETHSRNFCAIKSSSKDKHIVSLRFFADAEEVICVVSRGACKNLIINFRLFVLDVTGNAKEATQTNYPISDRPHTYFQFRIKKKELFAGKRFYLPNDVLTLLCECAFSTEKITSEIESTAYDGIGRKENIVHNFVGERKKNLESLNTLNENLKSLHSEQLFCDTTLKTKKQTFYAHKCILGVRSPVFKAMFTNDMMEKINNCINIDDLDNDAVQRMLVYMYTGELEIVQWESALKLYAAANKYEILFLKEECSTILKTNLCQSNACEALIFADLHSDGDLKEIVQDFIIRHGEDVINSDAWNQLMETHVKLAAETMLRKFK